MIRVEYARLVYVAFSRSNARRSRSCISTYKRALHTTPKLTVESNSIRSPATTATAAAAAGRVKREDCRYINLDSAFSKWKILVRYSNWKDHSMGKAGAERSRIQNLPNCTCPGNYEIGIAIYISLPSPWRDSGKLDLISIIIPVYFGQANNVRTRVQKYRRDGVHLENGSPNGPRLFSEIFSRGFSIVYRWAPTKSKNDAQRIEDELLAIYDYAWNKRGNGDRRRDDIRRKLESSCAKKSQLICLLNMMLGNFYQKLQIKTCNPFRRKYSGTDVDSNVGILSKILAIFWRQQPGRVHESRHRDDTIRICGVATGHGSICTNPPIKGRKRCCWAQRNEDQ